MKSCSSKAAQAGTVKTGGGGRPSACRRLFLFGKEDVKLNASPSVTIKLHPFLIRRIFSLFAVHIRAVQRAGSISGRFLYRARVKLLVKRDQPVLHFRHLLFFFSKLVLKAFH